MYKFQTTETKTSTFRKRIINYANPDYSFEIKVKDRLGKIVKTLSPITEGTTAIFYTSDLESLDCNPYQLEYWGNFVELGREPFALETLRITNDLSELQDNKDITLPITVQVNDIVLNLAISNPVVQVISEGGGTGSGANGKSAYEIAVLNGFTGTEAEWLISLKGADGEDFTYNDFTPEQLLALTGPKGADSAFAMEQKNTGFLLKVKQQGGKYSQFFVSFFTNKKDFSVGDTIRYTYTFKSSGDTIAGQTPNSALIVVKAGDVSLENLSTTSQSLVIVNDTEQTVSKSFVMTQAMYDSISQSGELALLFNMRRDFEHIVEFSQIGIFNDTKGFVLNRIQNVFKWGVLRPDGNTELLTPKMLNVPSITGYKKPIYDIDTRNLKGKLMLALGDSITNGTEGGYLYHVANKTGLGISNFAYGGASVASMVGYITGWAGYDAVYSGPPINLASYDIVYIQIGTNGGYSDETMASIYTAKSMWDIPFNDGTEDITTKEQFANKYLKTGNYLGKMALLIQYIQTENPNCKIVIVTPPMNNRGTGWNLAEIRLRELKSLCDYYNVMLINAYKNTAINKHNLHIYTYDLLHFNELGNKMHGEYIGAVMNSTL